MAKKKGICRNEECEMCDPSKIQEADEFNFVCEKCGQELFPIGGPGGGGGTDDKWKKWVIIGAAVAVLGGGGAFFALSGGDEAPKKEAKASVPKPQVQKPDTEKPVKPEPTAPAQEGGKGTSSPSAQSTTSKPTNPQPATPTSIAPKVVKNGSGSVNLGYGKYVGDLKDGKPHGHGTITYTKSHQIVSSKDFLANPGDKFEGEFRDGRISGGIGYWYHDGDITAIKP